MPTESVRDFMFTLESETLDLLAEANGWIKGRLGRFSPADYMTFKLRYLGLRTLYNALDARMGEIEAEQRDALNGYFHQLRGRLTSLYLEVAARYLLLLSDRSDLPLGIAEQLRADVDTVNTAIAEMEAADFWRYIDTYDPHFILFVPDLASEIAAKSPMLQDFGAEPSRDSSMPKRARAFRAVSLPKF